MTDEAGDSEDDYMSDKFLVDAKKARSNLVEVRSVQQRREVEERMKASKHVSREKQMAITREEGLRKKLGTDNVGFKLMMKMGFNPDGGLGKNAEGRSEPVSIEIPDGRAGLGLRQRNKSDLVAARSRRETNMQVFQTTFRDTMAIRFRMEKAQRQLNAARIICQKLDLSKDIDEPHSKDFWPPDEIKAKLLEQSAIIRREVCRSRRPAANRKRKHADSPIIFDELDENGEESSSKFDGDITPTEDSDEEFCDIDAAQYGTVESQPDEVLLQVTEYLHDFHLYCFWCGTQYEDDSDLKQYCPGPNESDHG